MTTETVLLTVAIGLMLVAILLICRCCRLMNTLIISNHELQKEIEDTLLDIKDKEKDG